MFHKLLPLHTHTHTHTIQYSCPCAGHERIRGSGSTAPLMIHLGTRRGVCGRLHAPSCLTQPPYTPNRRLGGHKSRSRSFGEGSNIFVSCRSRTTVPLFSGPQCCFHTDWTIPASLPSHTGPHKLNGYDLLLCLDVRQLPESAAVTNRSRR